jgi:Vitamin K-dependent gamma-carboxylase
MSPLAARARAWLFDSAFPAERIASLRVLVFGFGVVYLAVRFRQLTDYSSLIPSDFAPVGIVSLLSAPLPLALVLACYSVTLLAGVTALLGIGFRWSGPLFALGQLWVLSYRSSWGMIFHTENLLVLHTLILSASPAADVWRVTSRSPAVASRKLAGEYAWPVHAVSLVTVLSYAVAGVAKLKISGLDWVSGEALRSQVAFDALRKIELGSSHAWLGAWLVPHRAVFTPLAYLTFAFELGAPLALLGGRVARVWCVTAWAFHAGVVALMLIVFPYALCGVAFASFFACEKPMRALGRLAQRTFGVRPGANP